MTQTGRERTHYCGDGCVPPHEDDLNQRPGDQSLPEKNSSTPIQDLVTRELRRYGYPQTDLVIADIEVRRQVGIARYGTPLQAHNGRDALRDLYEEAMDGTFYARQGLEELGGVSPEAVSTLSREQRRRWQVLYSVYRDLMGAMCSARMLMEEQGASTS
jgi:hypothetical protein